MTETPELTRSRLFSGRRLLLLGAEALSVVFAVLVALAVDEYWEDRENIQLAEQTVDAIAREIQENRDELARGMSVTPDSTLPALRATIAALREGREMGSLSVNWEVAILSSAAWETAQVTEATRYMDLETVIRLAKLYELQRFYTGTQDALASLIATVAARMETDPIPVLIEVQSRLATALGQRETLSTVYACVLVDLVGPDAVEPGACPDDDP